MELKPPEIVDQVARRTRAFMSESEAPKYLLQILSAEGLFTEGDLALSLLREAIELDEKVKSIRTLQSKRGVEILLQVEVC